MTSVRVAILVEAVTDMPDDDFAADDHFNALVNALVAAANDLEHVYDGSASVADFTVLRAVDDAV